MAMDIWFQLHLERISNLPRKWRLRFQHNKIVSANSTAETDNLLSVWCSCENIRYHRKKHKVGWYWPSCFSNEFLSAFTPPKQTKWLNKLMPILHKKNITLANMLPCSVLLLLLSYCGVDSLESCVAATCKAQMERESFWKPLNMNPTLARSNSLDSFRANVTLTDILCLYPKSQITAYFSCLTFDVVSPTWVGTHISALFLKNNAHSNHLPACFTNRRLSTG